MKPSLWELSDEDKARLSDARVVVSMSGGKDSTACALLLRRNGIEFDSVFMDTGWEHPALYDYLEGVLEPTFGKIERLKSAKYPGGMVELIRKKKAFPGRRMRFCTQELKVKPFEAWVSAQGEPVINVVGIRRQESKARANAKRWEFDGELDVDIFRPLIEHTFDDVIAMHKESGIAPNPLYLQGAERVGCYPCIFARKSEVDQIAKVWPQRIDQIAALEEELTTGAKSRAEDPDTVRPKAFFDSRANVLGPVDIRTVVQWSKTDRGGRQYTLFDSTASDGCTRWGMCESPLAREDLIKITG